MTQRLAGQNALITGSTTGIGKATALAMAAEGARVIVTGRDAERGKAVVAEIEAAGGRAEFVLVDLASGQAAVEDLIAQAGQLTGGTIDILVNNAAIRFFAPETEEQIDAMLAVNIKAPYLLITALAPAMAERGSGAIINLGSIAAKVAAGGIPVYGAANNAKHSLTRTAAATYGPSGVRVNTVAPGTVSTEAVSEHLDQVNAMLAGKPSPRASTPAEIAAAIVFLASAEASNIHGTELFVDGGHTIA
jgi:NAD(P)-dependent dehydrogenase (short-subunit alcohol dehydrogenase family)